MSYLKQLQNFQKKYKFKDKPLLLGGGAMEYYNLRKTGKDLDILISNRDKKALIKEGYNLNLFGGKTEKDVDSSFSNIDNLNIDLVITLNQYDYKFFKKRAVPHKGRNDLLVLSLEDLLMTKVFAEKYGGQAKHKKDISLIIKGIEKQQGYK
tara:strand:+ start:158 stop:613 length:456 start_codon:yes stop_codon:yes gene_type:complete